MENINIKNNNKSYFDIIKKILSSFLLIAVMIISGFEIAYYDFLILEPEQKVLAGEEIDLPQVNENSFLPQLSAIIRNKTDDAAYAISNTDELSTNDSSDSYQLDLTIGNKIPVKSLQVKVIRSPELIVGGHSIGILLQTEGVTVVGHSPVVLDNGDTAYPAKDAGIESGDFIIEINGVKVNTNAEVSKIINQAGAEGEKAKIKFIRDGATMGAEFLPVYCNDTKNYRIGLYIRDNTAGVGTLTYYDTEDLEYGALGHMVSDLNNNKEDNSNKGIIVRADIQGIKASRKGSPGEKLGVFLGSTWQGSIEKNTTYGIFGTLEENLTNEFYPEPLSIALEEDVELGPAEICTVLQGEEIEQFSINIVKLLPNYRSSGKGMIIEITDPELLRETGGIIQGMSGSPIIQNGRLVGAVTHVFVNEPEKGYACYAEWMLEEAGLLN